MKNYVFLGLHLGDWLNDLFYNQFLAVFQQFRLDFKFFPSFVYLFNCSWAKFIAIIVNVFVSFYAKILLDRFNFRVTFTSLTFSRDLKFFQSQFQKAELNWRQINTKVQWKVRQNWCDFFILNFVSACNGIK